MQNTSGSYRNLAALAADELSDAGALSAGGPLSFTDSQFRKSHTSVDSAGRTGRCELLSIAERGPLYCKLAACSAAMWSLRMLASICKAATTEKSTSRTPLDRSPAAKSSPLQLSDQA